MKRSAEGFARHMVRIAVVFLLQTIVLPLLFLWLMVALGRRLITGGIAFNNQRKA